MKNLLIISLLLYCISSTACAQDAQSEINKFPLPVIFKVKHVAASISISAEKQLALARFFQKEELAIANLYKNSSNPQTIQTVTNQLRTEFYTLLTPQQLKAYSDKNRGSVYAKVDSVRTKN